MSCTISIDQGNDMNIRKWVDFYNDFLISIFKTRQLKRIMFKIEHWMIYQIFSSSINTWNENTFVILFHLNHWIAIIDHIILVFPHTNHLRSNNEHSIWISLIYCVRSDLPMLIFPQYFPTTLCRWLDTLIGCNANSILQFGIQYHLLEVSILNPTKVWIKLIV